MHGMPLAIGRWERVPNAGSPQIEKTGNWEWIEATYAEALSSNEFRMEFARPGWYLVGVQIETLRADTEIELLEPTAEAISTLGRWRCPTFVQINSIAASGTGTADPSYTTLNRIWAATQHAAIWWTIKTTTANQRARFRIVNGTTAGNRAFDVNVWRLFDFDQTQTETPNVLAGPIAYAVGNVTVEQITPYVNAWTDPRPIRYRVTCSGTGATNRVRWECSETALFGQTNLIAANYTHQLRVKIKRTAPGTAAGDVTLTTFAATAGAIDTRTLSYSGTEAETVIDFARRTGGDAISEIRLSDIEPADDFEIEAVLNVTD